MVGKAAQTRWQGTKVCHIPTATIHVSRAPLGGWSCTFSWEDRGLYQAVVTG